jgi:hypothetical protein
MDRDMHVMQDAAEHYAVYVMQKEAERLGVATEKASAARYAEFVKYLNDAGFTEDDFIDGEYKKYKSNADAQLPRFVQRLSQHFPGQTLSFENVETAMRILGMKGDFFIRLSGSAEPIAVSLKNYIGGGGILTPQVGSGTYASFAAGFVFDRVGVGKYLDPRERDATFTGSVVETRNEVLEFMGRADLIPVLAVLDRLQAEVREEFLGPDMEFYDRARLRAAVVRVSDEGIETMLKLFELLGEDQVRTKFLEKIGLDGREEALYFDSDRYLDSITNASYHSMRALINDPDTEFSVARHKQGIRFSFTNHGKTVLSVQVPLTINTNGAWYRPRVKYEGTQEYQDGKDLIAFRWGERRPFKSKQIATSTNQYIDLRKAGILVED